MTTVNQSSANATFEKSRAPIAGKNSVVLAGAENRNKNFIRNIFAVIILQFHKMGNQFFKQYLVSPQTTQNRFPSMLLRACPIPDPLAPKLGDPCSTPSPTSGRLSQPTIPTSDPPPTEIEQSRSPLSIWSRNKKNSYTYFTTSTNS